ncbi:uncharacterized protein LOC106636755 [Copidosoma floridanum]|uniref:uncharacterized protein LOC106636755 n=1 Tax=Copidosoma floridanum TaxID=29053 RepID=UPI0006C98953|nr:uncharacterized protein LOC106636755 [Copidosoma floridanum]
MVVENSGLTQKSVKKNIRKGVAKEEEMRTILRECEAAINARPIAQLSKEKENLIALTPEMFLKEKREDGVPDLDQVGQISLNKRLKYLQRLKLELRQRFRSEYLGQLERHDRPRHSHITVKVGDVVLIGNDVHKRIDWPMGHVVDLIPGHDGVVRVAKLKAASGHLVRPLQRLKPLECSATQSLNVPEEVGSSFSLKKNSTCLEQEETYLSKDSTREEPTREEAHDRERDSTNSRGIRSKRTTCCGRTIQVPKRFC